VRVTVVDYGIGNLYSVRRAFESVGAEVDFAGDAGGIENAGPLVLPGVGAFADGMAGLFERRLVEPLRRHALAGRPLLGICLGMQMLAEASEEFGVHEGLGLVPGRVRAIADRDADGHPLKIPHIGWTPLVRPDGVSWAGSPLDTTLEGSAVYLVHSFAVVPRDAADRLADCLYGGQRICAALRRGRIFGAQFHPEKSGPVGLEMLRRFLAC